MFPLSFMELTIQASQVGNMGYQERRKFIVNSDKTYNGEWSWEVEGLPKGLTPYIVKNEMVIDASRDISLDKGSTITIVVR